MIVNSKEMAQLRLKDIKQTEAVRQLMIRCFGGSELDYEYQPKPKLRLKPLGASSSSGSCPNARIESYISKNILELMSRTVV
jgi:hypothetical protein